jgi:hypothetical protein
MNGYNRIQNLIFMQDNAPCHKSRSTIAEPEARGIGAMKWLALSLGFEPNQTRLKLDEEFATLTVAGNRHKNPAGQGIPGNEVVRL